MEKKRRKWIPVLLVAPLLLSQWTLSDVHGMRLADEFEPSLLFKMDFNQNDFTDSVTKKQFLPNTTNGKFDEGVRYNSYRLSSDKFSIPFSSFKAGGESSLTSSFWVYPEAKSGTQKMIQVGSHTLAYQSETGEWLVLEGDMVVSKVQKVLQPNRWTHIVFQLDKSKSSAELWLDGEKTSLNVMVDSRPKWNDSSTVVVDGALMSAGSRIDEIEIRKGVLNQDLIADISKLAYIPDLQGEVIGRNPHLSWSSDILPENVLVETSLESGQMTPSMSWGWDKTTLGGQSIEETGAYSGSRAIKIVDTINNGNHYGFPDTKSNRSISMWNRMHFPNGTNLSVTYYAKAVGGASSISQNGDGGWATSFSTKQIIKLTKPVAKGERVVHVDSVGSYGVGQHLTFDEVPEEIGAQYVVESLDSQAKTLTLRSPLHTSFSAGKEIRNRPWRGAFSFGTRSVPFDGDWHRLSQNTKVYDFSDYNVLERGASFYTNFATPGTMHFDNVKLGYATKAKLYRDNTLLYEGFLSDYRDTSSKDTASPGVVESPKVTRTQDKITVSFAPAQDRGRTYSYRIQAVTNDGGSTPLSKESRVEVLSGIKGYSYVMDETPFTIPSTVVNTTSPSISHSASDNRDRYLHIRAIDNEGNAGDTVHLKISRPVLNVAPDKTGTYAVLDWSIQLDSERYQYKAYKRKKGETEFQSISTFEQDSGKELKVLNLYPAQQFNTSTSNYSSLPSDTFTTWKGERKTLPRSAGLERWMEEPNSEHPKGYGKGLIDVEPISYEVFNARPSEYLKKVDGKWNYDAVFFGSWDANAYEPDFPTSSYETVKEFADDGQGILLGHDVVRHGYSQNGFLRLKNLLNIEIDAKYGTTPISQNWSTNGKTVRLKKTGLMTKYPWNIGDIGSNLSIPSTHTLTQITYGDVWLDFPTEKSLTDANGNGDTNFYLTTWNNTGMIQTGHSNGQATPDEQKILANTLFYLSQKTSDTTLNDYSSVDDSKPNVIGNVTINSKSRSVYDADFSPVKDNGTTYEYYVEAIGQESQSRFESPIVQATIESGLKGYSVEVGSNPLPTTITTTHSSSPLSFTTPYRDKFYVHLKAIDNMGNHSVKTMSYDSQVAELIVEPVSDKWTNQEVELKIRASQALGKVANIRLPNGQVVTGDMASYVVRENGLYLFYGQDIFGQWVMGSYVVNKIDKTKPLVDVNGISPTWTNQDVKVDMTAN